MKDVYLDFFRGLKNRVLQQQSGYKLEYTDGFLTLPNGDKIAKLSSGMCQRLTELENKGYAVSDAEVSYVLAWRPKEEKEEVAVCLANMILIKQQ